MFELQAKTLGAYVIVYTIMLSISHTNANCDCYLYSNSKFMVEGIRFNWTFEPEQKFQLTIDSIN